MSAHHLLNEEEMKNRCIYCGKELEKSKWESLNYTNRHYKLNECPHCHKTAKVQVGFEGSGHDSWGKPFKSKRKKTKGSINVIESPLEKAIKEN